MCAHFCYKVVHFGKDDALWYQWYWFIGMKFGALLMGAIWIIKNIVTINEQVV